MSDTSQTSTPIGGRFAWERVLFSVLMTAAAGAVATAAGAVIQSRQDVAVQSEKIVNLGARVETLTREIDEQKSDAVKMREGIEDVKRQLIALAAAMRRGREDPQQPPARYPPYAPQPQYQLPPPGPAFRGP